MTEHDWRPRKRPVHGRWSEGWIRWEAGLSRFWGDFPIMPRHFVFMLQHWADLVFLFEKFNSFLRNIYLAVYRPGWDEWS